MPVQITFRNMDSSAAVAARIRQEADKLDKFFDRITSCRVIVEAPHRRHRYGDLFHIRIELRVPGKELVVAHEPTLKHEDKNEWHKQLEVQAPHKDVLVAIRDAFEAIRRQLKDYVRCLAPRCEDLHSRQGTSSINSVFAVDVHKRPDIASRPDTGWKTMRRTLRPDAGKG